MPYKVAEPVKTSIFLPTQKASTVGGFVNTLSSLLRRQEPSLKRSFSCQSSNSNQTNVFNCLILCENDCFQQHGRQAKPLLCTRLLPAQERRVISFLQTFQTQPSMLLVDCNAMVIQSHLPPQHAIHIIIKTQGRLKAANAFRRPDDSHPAFVFIILLSLFCRQDSCTPLFTAYPRRFTV